MMAGERDLPGSTEPERHDGRLPTDDEATAALNTVGDAGSQTSAPTVNERDAGTSTSVPTINEMATPETIQSFVPRRPAGTSGGTTDEIRGTPFAASGNTLELPTDDREERTAASGSNLHPNDQATPRPTGEGGTGALWGTVEANGQFVPGQVVFSRYIIEKKLGAGGMGDVWLVKHKELNADRALKVIVSRISLDQQARARFRREAQIMASFHHPNAVVVHDARLTEHDVAYIDMEFVEGKCLSDIMRKGEPMPLPWIARMLDQLCDVLEIAHKKGIVHRDLKPANLMLLTEREEGREHLKVLDFGIAKVLSDAEQTESGPHTQTGAFLGTPFYASPEQIEGNADTRSDIYSVGVILYEFLTGFRPFTGPAARVFVDVSMTPPPTFATINPRVEYPPAVEALVMRCLAKSPADRPQTAREIAEGFRAALPESDLPPAVKVIYGEPPTDPWRWLKFAAAVAVIAIFAGAVGWILRPRIKGTETIPPVVVNASLIPEHFVALPDAPRDDLGRAMILTPTGEAEPIGLRMIVLKGGTFQKGDPTAAPFPADVADFAISESEVTNGQMKAYYDAKDIDALPPAFVKAMDELKKLIPEKEVDQHPAVGIPREDALGFAKWVGGELPTDTQWEYAVRSGGKSDRHYVWADDKPKEHPLVANSGRTNIDTLESRDSTTSRHGDYGTDKTDQGVFDLMGNVREWCRDPGPSPDTFWVRGGSFATHADQYSNYTRQPLGKAEIQNDLGFRVVVEMPPVPPVTKQ